MGNYLGKICPYCKTKFIQGDRVIFCPSCEIPHHEECWKENEGCTVFGCSQKVYSEQHTNPTSVCTNCGNALGDGQLFCPKCGMRKEEQTTPGYAMPESYNLNYNVNQYAQPSIPTPVVEPVQTTVVEPVHTTVVEPVSTTVVEFSQPTVTEPAITTPKIDLPSEECKDLSTKKDKKTKEKKIKEKKTKVKKKHTGLIIALAVIVLLIGFAIYGFFDVKLSSIVPYDVWCSVGLYSKAYESAVYKGDEDAAEYISFESGVARKINSISEMEKGRTFRLIDVYKLDYDPEGYKNGDAVFVLELNNDTCYYALQSFVKNDWSYVGKTYMIPEAVSRIRFERLGRESQIIITVMDEKNGAKKLTPESIERINKFYKLKVLDKLYYVSFDE